MPTEQRVIATPPAKIGGKIGGAPAAAAAPADTEEPKRSRKRLVVVLVVVLAVLGAGGYVAKDRLLGHHGATSATATQPKPTPTPKPGAVMTVDPISLNLADGHYLRLGLALQLTAKVKEDPDPSRALDAAIALFSGRTVADVSAPATRDKLKTQLADELADVYEGEVMGVYLTTYVTQ